MNDKWIDKIDKANIPTSVAIILDGNGRWAQKRHMPRSYGHKAGMDRVVDIVEKASNLGIKYLTLYAFSTENWKRPLDEVNYLMELLVYYLKNQIESLSRNNVRLQILGDSTKLPKAAEKAVEDGVHRTKDNSGMVLNIAINYGGRDEILRGVETLVHDIKEGKVSLESINEELFSHYLYTTGQPDPDLLIRPGGEQRLSNFLIYQTAYSEFYFTEVLWPDFNEEELCKAIFEYQNRNRRYGGIG